MPKKTETTFSVVFKKGMAKRNRLPLTHVIATLRELDFMIREVGRKVQQERGRQEPDGDFGVELLAGAVGLAFHKGSVKATAAMTKDVRNGFEALTRIVKTTDIIEKKQNVAVDEFGAPVVRGLARISAYQEKNHTQLQLQIRQGRVTERALFSEKGVGMIRELNAAEFAIDSVTLYGKLRKLTDQSRVEDQDDIWGELLEDNGDKWRIKFHPVDFDKARKLFTKQVIVFGDASYFKTKLPRIDVKDITEEKKRDYVAAFDRFSQEYERILGDRDAKKILADIRGR
jgi:hypothetical protein